MELQKEKGRCCNHLITNKGGVMIDAAMVLPVLILAVVLILSLMKESQEESRLYRDLCQKANDTSYVAELVDTDLPFLFTSGKTDTYHFRRTLFYRPFWGESEIDAEQFSLVCVFPKSGVKYHRKNCSTVENNNNYEVLTLKEAEDRGYLPCKLCFDGPDYFKK